MEEAAEHAVGTLTLTLTLTQTLTLTLTLTRWPRTRAPRMRTTEARLPHRTSEPRPEDGPGAHVKARMMYGHPTYHPSTVTRHEDGWLRRRRSPGALVRPRAGDRPRVGPRCVVCSALSYETRADTVFFLDSAARDRNTANRDSSGDRNARKNFPNFKKRARFQTRPGATRPRACTLDAGPDERDRD